MGSESLVIVIESPDPQRWFPDDAGMFADLIRIVQRKHKIDSNRVAFGGDGAGAAMALLAAAQNGDLCDGLAVVNLPEKTASNMLQSNPVHRIVVLAILDTPTEDSARPPALDELEKSGLPLWTSAIADDKMNQRQSELANWMCLLDVR